MLRVLLHKGHLKEGQLSEYAILSIKEVRSILMDLYKEGFLLK